MVREAVEASDRDDSQVALIMLDIDHFKSYNDTYGHVTGDNVLRLVAHVLKTRVRECDYVGRWGGEEFGVLLTGAGITEAKNVARVIRRAISELYLVDAQGHAIPNPTVPIPADTMKPGLEGTGPAIDLGMAMGALNTGAASWMWDWEDAGGDYRDQLYQAWENLRDFMTAFKMVAPNPAILARASVLHLDYQLT